MEKTPTIKKKGIGIRAGAIKDLTGFCKEDEEGRLILLNGKLTTYDCVYGRMCAGLYDPKSYEGQGIIFLEQTYVRNDQQVWLAEIDTQRLFVEVKVMVSDWEVNEREDF